MNYEIALQNLRASTRGLSAGGSARRTAAKEALAGMMSRAADGHFNRDELDHVLTALNTFASEENIPFDLELARLIVRTLESSWVNSGCSWDSSSC